MRIEREGEGVQVRGDVAGTARVGVVAPCSPDVRRPLDYHKVFLASLLESNRHAQSGEPRPQNGHTNMADTRFVFRRVR